MANTHLELPFFEKIRHFHAYLAASLSYLLWTLCIVLYFSLSLLDISKAFLIVSPNLGSSPLLYLKHAH